MRRVKIAGKIQFTKAKRVSNKLYRLCNFCTPGNCESGLFPANYRIKEKVFFILFHSHINTVTEAFQVLLTFILLIF